MLENVGFRYLLFSVKTLFISWLKGFPSKYYKIQFIIKNC